MNNSNNTRFFASLLSYGDVNATSLYMSLFNKIPGSIRVNQVNTEKLVNSISNIYANEIQEEMQYSEILAHQKKNEVYSTVIVLKEGIVLETGKQYLDIYFAGKRNKLVDDLEKLALQHRLRKSNQNEINIVIKGDEGPELSKMDIKKTKLDLNLYYNDSFPEIDELIRKRLNKQNDKGIVLLHGLPGTGKTTYLRYLVSKINKRVLFLPPDMAASIGNPEMIKLLIDNPNCVLVIEDAENIIMQRNSGQSSSVSNLLNISDGLMSDFLNVQLICTFNSPVSAIDAALMRKGRLIARYEFGKLPVEKAQKLSDKLGYKTTIEHPMSLAEITNQDEQNFNQKKSPIGFKTSAQTA